MGIDFNGHSPLWERDYTVRNHDSTRVEQFIREHGLNLLNQRNGPPTFYSSLGQPFLIDLTLHSSNMSVSNWSIVESVDGLLDHQLFTLHAEACPHTTAPPRRNWRRSQWTHIKAELESMLANMCPLTEDIAASADPDAYQDTFITASLAHELMLLMSHSREVRGDHSHGGTLILRLPNLP